MYVSSQAHLSLQTFLPSSSPISGSGTTRMGVKDRYALKMKATAAFLAEAA
jgi:hypothetical protein